MAKSVKYVLSLNEETHEEALTQARKEDRSVASLYRRIIYRYFQKRRKKDNGKNI